MIPRLSTRIEAFQLHHVGAVRAFNQRLAAGGISWRFPEHWVPDWLPKADHTSLYQEFFLLLEGESVRGAYVLKHQNAYVCGEVRRVGSFYLPLSEGIIDPTYALVGVQLMRDAMRREPLLYGLGMGGRGTKMARLISAMGWPNQVVPFYFKVRHGSRFLREIRYLRRNQLGSALLDLVAATGLGALAASLADLVLTRGLRDPGIEAGSVDECGEWLDHLWHNCAASYSFAAVRDRTTLNQVYPRATRDAQILRIARAGRTIGCAVVNDVREVTRDWKYFGELRVATIVDGVATPEHAETVVAGATRELEARGAELLVSNQLHPAWRAALRRAGFIRGPSNFLFATSPALGAQLRTVDPLWRQIHVNRGDGDVPWPGARLELAEWRAPSGSSKGTARGNELADG